MRIQKISRRAFAEEHAAPRSPLVAGLAHAAFQSVQSVRAAQLFIGAFRPNAGALTVARQEVKRAAVSGFLQARFAHAAVRLLVVTHMEFAAFVHECLAIARCLIARVFDESSFTEHGLRGRKCEHRSKDEYQRDGRKVDEFSHRERV